MRKRARLQHIIRSQSQQQQQAFRVSHCRSSHCVEQLHHIQGHAQFCGALGGRAELNCAEAAEQGHKREFQTPRNDIMKIARGDQSSG